MDNQRADLAQHILRHIAGALRRQHRCQTIFAALFGDKPKRVELNLVDLVSDGFIQKLMSLIQDNYKRVIVERAFASLR
ncbi:hypothetical protein DK26_19210 [Bosea sp. WAO]|nr:hypothetical protein DK26_19210 [Bosea sp. WAO]